MAQVFSSRSPRLGKPERFSTSHWERENAERTQPSTFNGILSGVRNALSCAKLSQVGNWDVIFAGAGTLPGSFSTASALVSVLNQHPSLPSLLPPPPWLKPRCSWVPSEAASILWVSGDFNMLLPESGPQTNDYPAIVLGAQGACQQICESLWLLSHEFSGYILTLLPPLWCFFFLLSVPWLLHSKKAEGSAKWRPLHTGWVRNKWRSTTLQIRDG